MSDVDLDRVRVLARQLHTALGLDAEQRPTRKKLPAEVRYEEADNGWWQIDVDEDGNEIERRMLPKLSVGHGLESTEGN